MGGGDGDGGVCNVHGALGSIIIMREVHWSMHKKHKERQKMGILCILFAEKTRRDECMEWIFGGEAVKNKMTIMTMMMRRWRWGDGYDDTSEVMQCIGQRNATRKDEDG